jgi:hypothetical protein
MNQHYADWANPNRRMDWEYSEIEWAQDVLKAVNEGKPMHARLVAEAWRIVGTNDDNNVKGLKDLLRAINQVAYSRMVAEDKVVEKYTNKYTVINFRLRPWRENLRVNYAHSLHWQDIELSKLELKRAG